MARLLFPAVADPPRPLVLPVPSATSTRVHVIPDVAGLTINDARVAMRQAGVDSAALTVEDKPYGAAVGAVVGQEPSPGQQISNSTHVVLQVATPATMPSVVGRTQADAEALLATLGVLPRITWAVTSDKAVGAVLSSTPAVGAAIAGEVTLEIASAGDAVYLTQLRAAAAQRMETRENAVGNGQKFATAIALRPTMGNSATAEYAVSKRGVYFMGTLAIDDQGGQGAALVKVIADGTVLLSQKVGPGQAVPVSLPISGVVRLQLVASVDVAGNEPAVLLGDGRLTGTTQNIDALASGAS